MAVGNRGNRQRTCDSWITNFEIKYDDQEIYAFVG